MPRMRLIERSGRSMRMSRKVEMKPPWPAASSVTNPEMTTTASIQFQREAR